MSLNRRNFLKIAGIASVSKVFANTNQEKMAKLIDLSLCDGCANLATPLCVSACKLKNKDVFPKPISEIPNYYPQKFYEDYQDKKDEINRLNPYNFIYVEKLNIDNKNINIPRHCMHCDDPTCLKICPFGAISKDNSAVKINPNVCFGGAKCKDVCPWHIPQRQAGVGVYLKIAPKLAGGGVMYKCDLCADISIPACVSACPKNAMIYANKEKIKLLALKKAQEYKDLAKDDGTYIYGDKQNGGTATFYVSPISFEKIQEAINKKHANNTQGIAHMKVDVNNKITSNDKIIKSVLLSPIAGVLAGVLLRKKNEN